MTPLNFSPPATSRPSRSDPPEARTAKPSPLGLTPKEQSTGGRQCLGGISRAGDERLRQLLVLGATTVIRHAKPGSETASSWLLQLLERRPRKVVAVALANKMARIVWGMMTNGTAYRRSPQAA